MSEAIYWDSPKDKITPLLSDYDTNLRYCQESLDFINEKFDKTKLLFGLSSYEKSSHKMLFIQYQNFVCTILLDMPHKHFLERVKKSIESLTALRKRRCR